MNHLAHCYLSFDHEDWLVGNFMGDFVKGSAWKTYAPGVQHGLMLHRSIDAFTDSHACMAQSIGRIRPYAGRFAAPVMDILYDHILATNWLEYSDEAFDDFAERTYVMLEKRRHDMPEVLQQRLPRMIAGKFLHGYQHATGLNWVLGRFATRISIPFDPEALTRYFYAELPLFAADFHEFFPELVRHAQNYRIDPGSSQSG